LSTPTPKCTRCANDAEYVVYWILQSGEWYPICFDELPKGWAKYWIRISQVLDPSSRDQWHNILKVKVWFSELGWTSMLDLLGLTVSL